MERVLKVILENETVEQPGKFTLVTPLFLVEAKGLILSLSFPKHLTH